MISFVMSSPRATPCDNTLLRLGWMVVRGAARQNQWRRREEDSTYILFFHFPGECGRTNSVLVFKSQTVFTNLA